MTEATNTMAAGASTSASEAVPNRFMPLLIVLFVGSGCAALIYEIVWFQLLTLNLGSSAISMAVLLGTFMGGMCLGSLLLPKYVSKKEHPLQVYARIEFGIGLLGIAVLFLYPLIGGVYTKIGGPGMFGIGVRAIIAAFCLLPPTFLMGATLPAIARWVESTPKGVSWLGFFYGGNIAGAVLGCLLAGFVLLRNHDVQFATFTAVAINFVIGALAFGLAQRTPHTPPVETASSAPERLIPAGSWPVYVTIMLSGLTALAAEVVWTRLLSLNLGGTTYTFSLILAGFLMGLGIGSSAGASMARTLKNPRLALGFCQMMIVVGIAWASYQLTTSLPNWPINLEYTVDAFFNFQMDLARCLWVVLPAAVFWGASFPLALAAVASDKQDPGRLVGTVYAANTVGAIFGAVFASILGIKLIGTQHSTQVLMVIAALSSIVMFVSAMSDANGKVRFTPQAAYLSVFALILAAFFARTVQPVPPLLIGYGRYAVTWRNSAGNFIYWAEGMNSSMAVSQTAGGMLNYHNAGKIQASSLPQDMSLQRMLGHLTTLLSPSPDTVLVIGCGAGVTAGAVSIDPAVKHETIAEIEPLVPEFVAKHFGEFNYNVISNPKVFVQKDDARHFLLTHRGQWDAITSDPFDPWVKGAATLYTEEFWKEARKRLRPNGVVTVFVQLYESGMDAVKSEMKTFFKAFPNGIVFGNTYNNSGYDVVMVGLNNEGTIDVDAIEAKLQSPQYMQLAQSLREIGVYSAVDLFAKFAARGPMLDQWLADAEVNQDRNLRLQYLAGRDLNRDQKAEIYSQILSFRQYPEGLFVGKPETLEALRVKMLGQ